MADISFGLQALSGLADPLIAGLERRRQQEILNSIPVDPATGMPSLAALGAGLLRSGDVKGAMTAAQLHRQAQNDAITQANERTRLGYEGQRVEEAKTSGQAHRQAVLEQIRRQAEEATNLNTYRQRTTDIAERAASRREAPSVIEIYDEATGQPRKALIDPLTQALTPIGGAKANEPKPLSEKIIKDVGDTGKLVANLEHFNSTFRPEFAGQPLYSGEIKNQLGASGLVGQYGPQSDFWRQYASFRNEVRHGTFGASLTPGEKSEFEKADVHPGLDEQRIKVNFARQLDVARQAAKRLTSAHISQGANPDVIESALGVPLGSVGVDRPAPRRAAPPSSLTGPSADPRADRFNALVRSGLNEDQAYARMRAEGL